MSTEIEYTKINAEEVVANFQKSLAMEAERLAFVHTLEVERAELLMKSNTKKVRDDAAAWLPQAEELRDTYEAEANKHREITQLDPEELAAMKQAELDRLLESAEATHAIDSAVLKGFKKASDLPESLQERVGDAIYRVKMKEVEIEHLRGKLNGE